MGDAMQQEQMSGRDWAILLLLSVLWGGSFFFIEIAVGSIRPLTLVLLRVALASAVLLIFLRLRGERLPRGREPLVAFALIALINNALPFALLAWAQTRIDSGLASILNATTPIWGVVVAHRFTSDEKATPAKVAGVLLGFGGVAAMIGPTMLLDAGGELAAQLACVAAALSYALAGVYGRRFKRWGISPIHVSAGQLGAATLILLPFVLALEPPWLASPPTLPAVGAVVALALLSTTFAYVLYFRLIESAGATNALLVTLLVPVTAILLGSLLLGEVLEPRHFAGMALIAAGLAAIDGRLLRVLRPSPAA
jgi:drug/metabolite transporter (DMT)-like permease